MSLKKNIYQNSCPDHHVFLMSFLSFLGGTIDTVCQSNLIPVNLSGFVLNTIF